MDKRSGSNKRNVSSFNDYQDTLKTHRAYLGEARRDRLPPRRLINNAEVRGMSTLTDASLKDLDPYKQVFLKDGTRVTFYINEHGHQALISERQPDISQAKDKISTITTDSDRSTHISARTISSTIEDITTLTPEEYAREKNRALKKSHNNAQIQVTRREGDVDDVNYLNTFGKRVREIWFPDKAHIVIEADEAGHADAVQVFDPDGRIIEQTEKTVRQGRRTMEVISREDSTSTINSLYETNESGKVAGRQTIFRGRPYQSELETL